MPIFEAFGLQLDSDLKLPLQESSPNEILPRVRIRQKKVAKRSGPANFCLRSTPGIGEIHCAEVVRIRVENGEDIRYQPLGDPDRVGALLLGVAMAVLLEQRGLQVFHGGIVQRGKGALMVVGEAGAGKSTSVGWLCGRGFHLLSDDLGVLLGREALSGYPFMRLWPKSLEMLGLDPASYPEVYPGYGKRIVSWEPATSNAALRGIVILEQGAPLGIERLSATDALMALVSQAFNARWGPSGFPSEVAEANFKNCTALIREVPVFRLSRPSTTTADQVGELLLKAVPSSEESELVSA